MKHQIEARKEGFYSMKDMLDLQKELNDGLEKLNEYIHQLKQVDYFEEQRCGLKTHLDFFKKIRKINCKIIALAGGHKSIC